MLPVALLPAVSVAGYQIGKSLRFRSSATAYLNRTLVSPTNRDQWSFSFWTKRGKLGVYQNILATSSTDNEIGFLAGDTFLIYMNGAQRLISTQLFRDPAAWYHFLVVADLANGTNSLRLRVYLNGVEITAWGTDARAGLGASTGIINTAVVHRIGDYDGAGTNQYDGNLAECVFVDGQVLTPSSFGLTDATTGAWIPKKYSGTYGTNGFYLDFSDNSSTSNLCLDRSGNGNNWTPNNISVTAGVTMDSLTDTPTLNYPVLSVPQCPAFNGTVSDGNLTILTGVAGNMQGLIATFALPSSGKWYWEAKMTAGSAGAVGIADAGASVATKNVEYYGGTGNKVVDTANTAYGATYTSGDYIGVAIDIGGGTITFYKNNASQGAITYTPSVTMFPIFDDLSGGATATFSVNFGQQGFNYTPPSGYSALNSANLSTPTIKRGSNGFVAGTDTGTNVQTTLATARNGWGGDAYLEVFKDRAAVEGWRWRFSDDSANYLDSSSTAAKAAFPALTGADSYLGYALRLSTSYGMATGTLSHTNGVTDTVTDNVGNARKLILLKRTDNTSNWFIYHPDVAAGSLLYLNTTGAAAVDASINTVASNSFKVDTGLPTGTYRWVAIAETSGFFKLGKYTPNASADGPFNFCNLKPKWVDGKKNSAGPDWWSVDSARSTYNQTIIAVRTNATSVEDSGTGYADKDFLSNGFKVRTANAETNTGAVDYYWWAFAECPFKYATAR